MNINSEYIKGKYIWPLFAFIWFLTILYIVSYKVSWLIDHVFAVIDSLFFVELFNNNINEVVINRYTDILVRDICKFPKTGASKLIKFLTSNWSNGEMI